MMVGEQNPQYPYLTHEKAKTHLWGREVQVIDVCGEDKTSSYHLESITQCEDIYALTTIYAWKAHTPSLTLNTSLMAHTPLL